MLSRLPAGSHSFRRFLVNRRRRNAELNMLLLRRFAVVGFVLSLLIAPALSQTRRVEYHQGRRVAAQEILVRFKPTERARSPAALARNPDIVQTESLGRTGAVRLRSRERTAASLLEEYARRSDV